MKDPHHHLLPYHHHLHRPVGMGVAEGDEIGCGGADGEEVVDARGYAPHKN